MSEPISSTKAGDVRGYVDDNQLVFLGLPYAAPPLRANRFMPPAPVVSWSGTRDATHHGPTAPQPEQGWTTIPEPTEPGDDFLNLNVFTPDIGHARLPVLVWIHGGSFVNGCNSSAWYRGTRFARDGVVLVAINYRLGIEGFLEMQDAPSNRAVLDWIAALEWVADNIENFGGDPDKVTIGGQSAGSAACVNLLAHPRARGLFRRAICQSGVADTRMTAETAQQLGRSVAEQLGVRPTRDDLSSFPPEKLIAAHAEMAERSIPVARRFDPSIPALKPFVDGMVIAEHPMREVRKGAGADVDLLAGATAGELNGLARVPGAFDESTATAAMDGMGLDADARDAYMRHIGVTNPVRAVGQALTDYVFRVPVNRLLDARKIASARTFAYDFRWPSPAFDGAVGSAHCLDIPFAFDNLDAERVSDGLHGPGAPQELADEMHRAWVRFVTDGDPGWPAYESQRRATMLFDVPSVVADDPLRVERTLFTRDREVPTEVR